jgi:hypothetical protein
MATILHGTMDMSGLRNTLPFGPYVFPLEAVYDQFLATEIQISGTSSAQLVGGVSPSIAAFTALNFLLLYPDQQMKIGLHGVAAQADGFTLGAYGLYVSSGVTMTSLQAYNTSATTVNLFVILGQA